MCTCICIYIYIHTNRLYTYVDVHDNNLYTCTYVNIHGYINMLCIHTFVKIGLRFSQGVLVLSVSYELSLVKLQSRQHGSVQA